MIDSERTSVGERRMCAIVSEFQHSGKNEHLKHAHTESLIKRWERFVLQKQWAYLYILISADCIRIGISWHAFESQYGFLSPFLSSAGNLSKCNTENLWDWLWLTVVHLVRNLQLNFPGSKFIHS